MKCGSPTTVASHQAARVGLRVSGWVRFFFVMALAGFSGAVVFGQTTWAPSTVPTTQNLWGVCYGGGQFVAVGEGGTILTSPDGAGWTARVSGNALWLVGVAYGDGTYVVVGDQGTILASTDGITWTPRASGTTARLNGAAFGGGRWVVVADSGEVLTSTDGAITWTRLAPSADRLRGVTYAYGAFSITGDKGLVRVTIDTTDFTNRQLPDPRFIESVVYAGRAFVAVGEAGDIITSPDGATWQTDSSNTTSYLRGVTFFNGEFIAVGDSGTILTATSPLGPWTAQGSGTTALFTSVAASAQVAVAVGFGGTIRESVPVAIPPIIITPPASTGALAGDNVLFSVRAVGAPPLAYQWSFNGQPLAGQTGDQLLLKNVQAGQAGSYTVTVSHGSMTALSAPATLALIPSSGSTAIVDPAFVWRGPAGAGPVTAMAEQADGKILVCASSGPTLYRLDASGALDPGFNPAFDKAVTHVGVQADGKILVAGFFQSINGVARPGLARLNADGSVDTSFVPAVTPFPAVSGNFFMDNGGRLYAMSFGGTTAFLVRLNQDGSVDPRFGSVAMSNAVPVGNGQLAVATTRADMHMSLDLYDASGVLVRNLQTLPLPINDLIQSISQFGSLLAMPDGGALVGTNYQQNAYAISFFSFSALRLAPDGTFDPAWQPLTDYSEPASGHSPRQTLAVAPDGKVYDAFDSGGQTTLHRYRADRSPDTTFDQRAGADAGQTIGALLPLRSGAVLVAGPATFDHTVIGPVARLYAVNAPARQAPVVASVSPESAAIHPGETVTLSADAAGTGPLTYHWNGSVPDADQGNSTVTVKLNYSGSYAFSVTVTNALGAATSAVVRVLVAPSAPFVVAPPEAVTTAAGRTVTFAVTAGGLEPATFQWLHNGVPILGVPLWSTLTLPNVTPADAGAYSVIVSNALGSVTSAAATLTVNGEPQLVNLSTRATAGPVDRSLVVGFVVQGVAPKAILLRAVGPGLIPLGLSGTLPDPVLTLYDGAGHSIATNNNWDTSLTPASLFASVGAFGLPLASADAVLLWTLPAGNYTATVTDPLGRSGTAIVEVYEADTTATRIINLSSRAYVGKGDDVAIAGFSVHGAQGGKYLVRAIGPGLTQFGVGGVLADPVLTLTTASGQSVATNDDWGSAGDAPDLARAATQAGAFALPAGSKDAALLVTLAPGNYTAIVSGANGTTGAALVEVYELR